MEAITLEEALLLTFDNGMRIVYFGGNHWAVENKVTGHLCGKGPTWAAAVSAALHRPVVARDEAAELRAENERLRQDRNPDYLYNPDDWEYTVPWGDRYLFDAEIEDSRGVVRYRTAYDGPDVFAASVPVEFDDAGWPVRSETQWFDSQEAAEEALLRVAASEGQS